jgi:hypothetical protein
MPYLPMDNPSVITVGVSDGFIPSVMFPRETFFFGAHVSVCKTVGVPLVGSYFFVTELTTQRVVTDDYYTDGRVPSERPSVIISPTALIPVTDGISPSVKLFNDVVGNVPIFARWRLSILTRYLHGSTKPPTSTGEVHFIRDRERIQ